MNNDLISRSALLEKSFSTAPATMINPYGGESVVRMEDIENAPAVDAVPVVRCKNCKHWDVEGLYCHHPAGLSYCGKTGAEKGFCCFGERREDHETDIRA